MNKMVSFKNHRWLVWVSLGVLTLIAASSPWFATIAYACQGHGGGC